MEISNAAADQLAEVIASYVNDNGDDRVQLIGEVLGEDSSGTTWVHILGGEQRTPVTSTNAKVHKGDIVYVVIGDGRADILGNVSRPSTDDTLAEVVQQRVVETERVVERIEATAITADSAEIQQLNADHAVIETLDSTYASIDNLNAATARIGSIEADYLVAADMTAEQARVGRLMAGKADVADLTAANARIDNLQSTKADISVLESDYITADAIDATYLHADMSNADVAWIQNGVIKDGSISNAMINSLSANKLTAGTINGQTINVTNINADNITAGTINGQRIGEGSLSLDKLSEDVYTEQEIDNKLATMQAEIDGAIETWTGTDVPTLNNSPASNWTTAAVRDTHVGDVYFVVNSQSEQNGYNYRFTKTNGTYSWQLIKDSDVTAALSRLNTAEGKITTFDSDISTLKTDTGTLKTKTESLETRMSDAEDDILDKVDTTTFNEVSDTVDQHSQTITQMSQTLSNKADGSTVTALTTRVSKTEQDITGINTTIGELQDTVETKADGSTVSTISNKLNTVSDTVDGHTQTLTSVQNTLNSKADSSTVSTLTTKVNNVSDTVDGHTQTIGSMQTTQTSIQGSAVKSTVQLWFTKANTTAPNKPTAHVTTNNASTANAWNLAVPTYNASYPYYYYCYEHQLLNDTYTWSAVTRDIATEESQSTSRSAASAAAAADTKAGNAATAAATADGKAVSAQNTADKNVRESQQLWYTKADSTAPAKPTSKVTSTATTGGAWTTRVPTYSDSYKHYFYCMQYVAADGTVTWSDVVYDQATTEAQSVARAASADLTEFHQEYATFKQTTQQFESTVGETYATKTELNGATDDITELEDRVSTNETSISNNASAIALKADSSDVYTKSGVDGLISTEVTNRNAAITAKANEITSTVSQTYTTKTEFDNLNVGNTGRWYATHPRPIDGVELGYQGADKYVTLEQQEDFDKDFAIRVDFTPSQISSRYCLASNYDTKPNVGIELNATYGIRIYSQSGGSTNAITDRVVSTAAVGVLNTFVLWWNHTEKKFTWLHKRNGASNSGSYKPSVSSSDGYTGKSTTTWIRLGADNRTDATWNTKYMQADEPAIWYSDIDSAEGYLCYWDLSQTANGNPSDVSEVLCVSSAKNFAELAVTADGISSTVANISSVKYVNSTTASWPLASMKTYAAEGYSENWNVTSTDGLRVGDTVYVKGTDSTRNCTVYIKTTVTAINSATNFTGKSHGYEDVLPVESIKSTINQSSDSVKIQARHVEIDGTAIFSAISSDVDDAITDKGYQTASQVNTAITSKGYATTTQAQGYATTAENNAKNDTTNKLKSYSTTAQANNLYDAKGAAQTVQDNLDNLEIGGRNLFGYGSDCESLSGMNNTGFEVVTKDGYTCAHAIGALKTAKHLYSKIPFTPRPEEYVTISGYVQINNITEGTTNPMCEFYPSGQTLNGTWRAPSLKAIYIDGVNTGSTYSIRFHRNISDTNWHHFAAVCQWPNYEFTANMPPAVYFRDCTGDLYVHHIKYERGNKATDWSPAPEDLQSNAVKRTQRIWYRKSAEGAPATPGTASSNWVVKADDGSNAWTKMHVAITETEKFIYTCEQYEMGDGTVGYTSVLLDNTITVIDGGNVITGSVTATQIAAGTITSEEIAGGTITSDNIEAGAISADRLDANALTVGNIAGLEDQLETITNGISSLSNSTQWVHFQDNVGTVFGEAGSANNVTVKADGVYFNTEGGEAARASAGIFYSNEMQANDSISTPILKIGNWALVQSGTTFSIEYLG